MTNKNKFFKIIKISFLCFIFVLFINFLFISLTIATSQTGEQSIEIPNPIGASDFTELINKIVGWLIVIFIPIGTIVVLYAAFLFVTSGGSTQKVQQAKKTLTWAVIGLIILFLAKGIILIIKDVLGG